MLQKGEKEEFPCFFLGVCAKAGVCPKKNLHKSMGGTQTSVS